MAKTLTDQQKLFLDFLFMSKEEGGASGDAVAAKRLAGYSEGYPASTIVKVLKEEIHERTREFFSKSAPRAAFRTYDVMEDPTKLGAKELLSAAKDILDRAGFSKTEKVEVDFSQGLFILPAKKEEAGEEQDD